MAKVGKESPAQLVDLWRRVQLGQASEQERIDAASLTAAEGARHYLSQLKVLLRDDSENVRYFALQALVLDLKEKTPEMAEWSWRLLETDSDEYVRSMAATCLSSIYFGQKRKDVFSRLARILRSEEVSGFVKGSVYSALHQLAGLPPSEWPRLKSTPRAFKESDIDWEKVAEVEDAMQ